MSIITRSTVWSSGDTLTAAALNAEFNVIQNDYNGSITNANISASAGIVSSKLASTISGKTFFGSVQTVVTYSPAISGTATLDCATANVFVINMPAGNITIALSNISVGQFIKIDILQDGVGSRTVTWFSTIKWPDGAAPTLTLIASKIDSFVIQCTSASNYQGYIVGQNL